MTDSPDWHHLAACRGKPISLFFPPSDEENTKGSYWDPRPGFAICGRCPVRQECEAEHSDEEYGIWFGQMKNSYGGQIKVFHRKCIVCETRFTSLASHSRYCEESCRRTAERRRSISGRAA